MRNPAFEVVRAGKTNTKIFELQHEKKQQNDMCAQQWQISLGVHPVWSESSLWAHLVAKDPSLLHVDSEDSDRTGQMPRLIWVVAGCTGHFVGLVLWWLI